jgi:beta-lactamase regulating signal transducer with metallopeptidase domain
VNLLLEIGLANAVLAALLAVLVAAFRCFCKKPVLLHALWLLVLAKLIVPPLLPLPIPGLTTSHRETTPTPGTVLTVTSASPDVFAAPTQEKTLEVPPRVEPDPVPNPAVSLAATPSTSELASSSGQMDSWLWLAGFVWLTGSLLWFLGAGVHIIRFQRLLRFARPAPDELQAQACRLATQLGLARCPPVWLVPGPMPPMVWSGFGPAQVFFPERLIGRLDAQALSTLLAHELAHVRRRDHWVRWLELVVVGLYWWYPLVWWVRRQVQIHEEECCDAWVVAALPARAYAGAILETIDFLAESRARVPFAASGLGRLACLKKRLTLIMERNTPKKLSLVGQLVVLAVIVLLPMVPTVAPAAPEGEQTIDTAGEEALPATYAQPESDADEALTFASRSVALQKSLGGITHLGMSRDGSLLATASEDRRVRLLSPASGRVLRVLGGHDDTVTCATFAPDGKTLATAGYDRRVILWDVASGKQRRVLTGHTSWVLSVTFAADGKSLASGGYDRSVRIWEAGSGKQLAVLTGHQAGIRSVAFAPDGKVLASASADQTVRLWNVATGMEWRRLDGHTGTVRVVAFSPNGQFLATGGEDNTARVWEVASGRELLRLTGHTDTVTTLAFSPRGQTLATGSLDQTIKVWGVHDGQNRGTLRGHRQGVTGLAYTPDGQRLLTASLDQSVRAWLGVLAPLPEEVAGLLEPRLATATTQRLQAVRVMPDTLGSWVPIPAEMQRLIVKRMPEGTKNPAASTGPDKPLTSPTSKMVGVMWLPDEEGEPHLMLIMMETGP